MREIKFRGRASNNVASDSGETVALKGEWVIGSFVSPDYITGEVMDEFFDTEFSGANRPETVGEYTGLTDMNGVEIYEGDIVDYQDEHGAVVWEDCEFIIQFDTWSTHLGEFYPSELEVIGNLHDNPELLGGAS